MLRKTQTEPIYVLLLNRKSRHPTKYSAEEMKLKKKASAVIKPRIGKKPVLNLELFNSK